MGRIAEAEKRAMAGESIPYVKCPRLQAELPLKRCEERQREYSKTWCKNCEGGERVKKTPSVDLAEIERKKREKARLGGDIGSAPPTSMDKALLATGKDRKGRADMEPVETEDFEPSPEAKAAGIEVNHRKLGQDCPCCRRKTQKVRYRVEYDDLEGRSGSGLCAACYQRWQRVKKKRDKQKKLEPVRITCGDCKKPWDYQADVNESCPHCMLNKRPEPADRDMSVLGPRELDWKVTDEDGSVIKEGTTGGMQSPVSENVHMQDAIARFLNKLCDGGLTITIRLGD